MHPKTTYERVRFEGFELDLGSGELFYEGRKVQLQEQPFQVLRILLEHSGQLVTREELRQQLWPADTFVDFDHNLNKAVAKLREALGNAGAKSALIETLTRRGYRFRGHIEPSAPDDPPINEDGNATSRQMESKTAPAQIDSVIDTAVEDETRNEKPKKASRRRLRVWLLPGAASVAVCLAAAIWYMQRPLPRLRIAKYTQITFDGQRKGVFARVYLDSDSPNLPSQMAASGGDRVPLRIAVPGRQFGICDVSPDGSELLIAALPDDSEVPGLWTQSILGGTFRRLAESESGGFSPDGKSVAYVSEDQTEIDIVNLDGTGARRLASPGPGMYSPRWSPDGEQIIFADFRDFGHYTSYIVSSDGGKSPEKLMPENPGLDGDPGWSPDGREIVFSERLPVARTEDIRILDLATHRVTAIPGSAEMYSRRWSADGRYIAALARVGPFLRVFNIAAQKWTVLKTTGIVAFPCFSGDSQTIYFLRYGVDQGIFRIRIPDGKEERVADLRETHLVSATGVSMSLDPTNAPLLTRAAGTDDVYALTLEEK